MDFDLSKVSVNTPSLFNLSKRSSSDDGKSDAIENRFDSTIVGSVYRDNAEKLHSDLIGIEEGDEIDDKHVQHNPTDTFPSYAIQQPQNTNINTYKDSTTSNTAQDNVGLSAGIFTNTKDNSFFEGNIPLQFQISNSNKFNEKQV